MQRKEFINLSTQAGLALIGTGLPLNLFSQGISDGEKYKNQFRLLQTISNEAKELGLQIGGYFYNRWKEPRNVLDSYLYVAFADKIESPHGPNNIGYEFSNTDVKLVNLRALEMQNQGYHTLVYTTAGTSATELTTVLLGYLPESISFIAFHEAAHQHIRHSVKYMHYDFEEACCDVIGNAATKILANKYNFFSSENAVKQTEATEEIYGIIMAYMHDYENGNCIRPDIHYKDCRQKVLKNIPENNQFMKTRFDYEVNNAYFLRNRYYGYYYPLLKEVMEHMGITRFIQFISTLGPDKDKTLEMLHDVLNKK